MDDDDVQVLFIESEDFSQVHLFVFEDEGEESPDWDVAECGETLPWGAIEVYAHEGRKPTEPVRLSKLCRACCTSLGARITENEPTVAIVEGS